MKKPLVFCLLLCTAGSLFAAGPINLFAGLGAEANAYTRKGAAAGGVLSLGVDIAQMFGAGIKTSFFHNFDAIGTLELSAFGRFYFMSLLSDIPLLKGFFAQAELGTAVLFEDSGSYSAGSYPAFAAALAVGWRLTFMEKFYVEPFVRTGYPFIWSLGFTSGLSFPISK